MLSILGNIDPAEPTTELKFPDGRTLRLPTVLLQEASSSEPLIARDTSETEHVTIVPIIEEQLEVSKRVVPTAQVHLQKSTETFDVTLNEPLAIRNVRIDRVALGHTVEAPPAVRLEGNTTVYPVLEERLVLTKELILVEEVRVTHDFSERRDTQVVSLRRERLDVAREDVVGA